MRPGSVKDRNGRGEVECSRRPIGWAALRRLLLDVAQISGSREIDERFETGWVGGARQPRIDFTGTAGKRVHYRVQVDVTGESSMNFSRNEYIKSAFVGVTGLGPLGRAEVGVIKEPVSMGVLTSGLAIDLMERGLPTIFAPSYNARFVHFGA